MAAPPARARADYDYLIKLLLLATAVWGRVVCFYDFLMVPSQPVLSPPLAYYRVEPWASCSFMMLLMKHLSIEWIRNIEQHASDNVNKILVGNKADMDESKRAVPTSKGQALADEYGIKFFETSAKTNMNVEEVFFSIARDIKQRLADTDSKAEPQTIKINQPDQAASGGQAAQKSACCGS
ncbi:Small GTPase superfamily [Sesbania bispinosa]|nr:Small GTPase superfamily [Sesbania bispinosa]